MVKFINSRDIKPQENEAELFGYKPQSKLARAIERIRSSLFAIEKITTEILERPFLEKLCISYFAADISSKVAEKASRHPLMALAILIDLFGLTYFCHKMLYISQS